MTAICARVHPQLRHFIETKMPALDRAIGPLCLDHIRQVFNAMTGLEIQPCEEIYQSTYCVYMELLEMDEAGTLLTEAMPKGLTEVERIKKAIEFVKGASCAE